MWIHQRVIPFSRAPASDAVFSKTSELWHSYLPTTDVNHRGHDGSLFAHVPVLPGLVDPFVAGRRVRREGKDREAVGAGGRETLALAMGASVFLVEGSIRVSRGRGPRQGCRTDEQGLAVGTECASQQA